MRFAILASPGIPDAPTIGTAVAGNALATVTFTPGTYLGKTGVVTYEVTSSPGGLYGAGTSSPIILGVTNGTSYTFTVKAVTNYGVSSALSTTSNSVTPAAPPTPPPGPPPPPPPPPCSCAPQPWPQNCTYVGFSCDTTPGFTQLSYQYYDCGCSQTCAGTGGYNQAYRDGVCGYVAVQTQVCTGCGNCQSNGCGGTVCYDSCGNTCSNSGCAPPPPPACPDCPGVGPCCAPLSCVYSETKQSNICSG